MANKLAHEGIEVHEFPAHLLTQKTLQTGVNYQRSAFGQTLALPWAVIGSTEREIDEEGNPQYVREYKWGKAVSTDPAHSDMVVLRDLIMGQQQWEELRSKTKTNYETWLETPARASSPPPPSVAAPVKKAVAAAPSVAEKAAAEMAAVAAAEAAEAAVAAAAERDRLQAHNQELASQNEAKLAQMEEMRREMEVLRAAVTAASAEAEAM